MGYWGEYDIEIGQVKKLSVMMLSDFDSFCKKHHLTYFISYGTCLGAVRHYGFIPWDDDVDVSMPIKDYLNFAKTWLKYGNKEKYFLQTKKTDPYIIYPFYRLRLNNTTWMDPGCEHIPIHWGIPIDIFPVYSCPKSKRLRKLLRKSYKWALKKCSYAWYNPDASSIKKRLSSIMTFIGLQICAIISICNGQGECADFSLLNGNYYIQHDICFPSKPIVFEGVALMGPNRPEEYLTWQYGDYLKLPPEEERHGHSIGILDLENDSEKYTGVRKRNK